VNGEELTASANGRSNTAALVTGATGFLGTNLVRRLLAEGMPVRALVRSRAKGKMLAAEGARVVIGDITEARAVANAVKGATVVYHLAGRLFVPDVPASEYHRTHVEGTKLLLAHCKSAPTVHRFVHCSTTGVLGVTGRQPADESAPLRPTNVYEATKAEAESVVRAAWRVGFPAAIARPGLVYGPGDLHLLPFFRSVLRTEFRPIGREPVWLHPIYIDDLTDALLRCGQHPAAVGECFHLAGREPASLAELAAAIARAAGMRPPRGHIPLVAAKALAAACEQLPATLRGAAPLTRSRLEFLTNSRVYDVTKAMRLLGFAAPTDLLAGTAQTMAWYRLQGHLPAGRPVGEPIGLSWSCG
jgi:nucleoside-diphosphate-sugar epimerase